jgi:Mrp family chromosome partitioning ATPase/capsular polysaccharide biosynthesis protein
VSIGDYLRLARRYLVVLVCAPLVLGAVGLLSARSQAKVYRSTAQVLLRPNDPNERVGTSGATGTEILNADRIVQAQADIAKGPTVRKAAAAKLGTVTEQELRKTLVVSPATNSNILSISADDIDPQRAASLANAVAAAFIENRRLSAVTGLESAIADLDEKVADSQRQISELAKSQSDPSKAAQLDTAQLQYRSLSDRRLQLAVDKDLKKGEAELIAPAAPTDQPISPKPTRTAALAAVLGLLGVAGAILLKDRLDTRLRSREDAEENSGLATLAEVPFDRAADKGVLRIAAEDDPDGLVAEAIRSLRVSLRFLGLDEPVKVILVTSALPADGKSTVSANLAHSYAESGARTLLVSADLRRPQVEKMSSVSSERGLVELFDEMASAREQGRQDRNPRVRERLLVGAAAITHYCHNDVPNLWVLPAGQRVANPVEILGSAVAKEFFARAAEDFDAVIIDSPPVLAVADAVVLSQFVDGVLVVTSIRKTQRPALARAVEVLRNGQANVLGLVLNRVGSGSGYGYGNGSNYGQAYTHGATRRATGLSAFARRFADRRRSGSGSGRRAA